MRITERDAHVNAVRAEHESRATHDDEHGRPPPAARRNLARARSQSRPRGGHVRRRAGHPAAMGSGHRDHPPHRHRRRHRTTPPPPRHADRAAPPAPQRVPAASSYPEQSGPAAGRRLDPGHPRRLPDVSRERHRPPTKPSHEPATSKQRETRGQLALGLTPRPSTTRSPSRSCGSSRTPRSPRPNSTNWRTHPCPAPTKTASSPGPAWPVPAGPDRDAVLQPPQPDVVPSARVLDQYHAAQRGAGHTEPERG